MPSRSIKNRTRGNQKGALPAMSKPSPGKLVQNFDGRANTNAGSYQQRMDGDGEPSGHPIYWINSKKNGK